jgi:hypothetical protein
MRGSQGWVGNNARVATNGEAARPNQAECNADRGDAGGGVECGGYESDVRNYAGASSCTGDAGDKRGMRVDSGGDAGGGVERRSYENGARSYSGASNCTGRADDKRGMRLESCGYRRGGVEQGGDENRARERVRASNCNVNADGE